MRSLHLLLLSSAGVYAVYSWSGIVDLFGKQYAAEMTGFYLCVAGIAFLIGNVLVGKFCSLNDIWSEHIHCI